MRRSETFAGLMARLARMGGFEVPEAARELAEKFDRWGVDLFWNPRLRTRAGQARQKPPLGGPLSACLGSWVTATVEMNPALEHDGPAAVFATLVHEMAHHSAGFAAGHGPVWKAEVRRLGGRAERCHQHAAVIAHAHARMRVVARCGKCGHEFHRTRRFPADRIYTHTGGCGGKLLPT